MLCKFIRGGALKTLTAWAHLHSYSKNCRTEFRQALKEHYGADDTNPLISNTWKKGSTLAEYNVSDYPLIHGHLCYNQLKPFAQAKALSYDKFWLKSGVKQEKSIITPWCNWIPCDPVKYQITGNLLCLNLFLIFDSPLVKPPIISVIGT